MCKICISRAEYDISAEKAVVVTFVKDGVWIKAFLYDGKGWILRVCHEVSGAFGHILSFLTEIQLFTLTLNMFCVQYHSR